MVPSLLRVLIICFGLSTLVAGAPPPALWEAIETFRTEGPKGWGFTQTTSSAERNRVETFDPLRPSHLRMSLIRENGAAPTEKELQTYREQQTRRTGGQTAPNPTKQMDLATAELVAEDGPRQQWRFRLKPGATDDTSAEHMHVTLTFHTPTATIERVVLANFEPFAPVFTVKVEEARTTIDYSLPTDDRPSLLQQIVVKVRGRAFYFKSLDSDMTVVYSDHYYAGKH
ncbi:hypothetical protein [Synoicihabitans lomoniglobus]|uniref:Uncharacterized protein n=1 Tax=Synoicihabitans lomoniglobus TaxID=2909285 RepID=A0AAF0CS93_9BACT|nr:hypothetical protein [Opitutaceae bacterium LMO-M01]WED67090.1 hypothetical protein PXH66_09525 [Opitutaceae bacterium LMO-M01]